jgi:hypothetical protein
MERTHNAMGGWLLAAALFAVALSFAGPRAFAAGTLTNTVPIEVKWNTAARVVISLTPNYVTGFGQVPATIGTQPAPTHGPNASLGTGSVDFGNIEAGKNYIYKYATHLNVVSNDPNGVNVYGEGAAAFTNISDSSTIPVSQAVYYLSSTSGSPADTNTGFSPGTPFMQTGGLVSGGGYGGPPATIAYTVYPSPIATTVTANADFYWDYQLKTPPTATGGQYYVWIVYTVVAK